VIERKLLWIERGDVKCHLETQEGPKRLFGAVEAYLAHKVVTCSARTVELEAERLSLVKKHFGDTKLTAITSQGNRDVPVFASRRRDRESHY
jgi:hypothetical protein